MRAEERRGDQRADEQRGQHPRCAQKTHDRRPQEVVLLLDGQRPCWADGRRQREMKEILQEQNVGPPRRGPDRVPDGGADEPWSIQIADDQDQYIDRPDAESAASVEVAEVVRLAAGLKQDRGDEKARKDKEEIDARPSPQRCVIEPRAGKARMAVVENDGRERRCRAVPEVRGCRTAARMGVG